MPLLDFDEYCSAITSETATLCAAVDGADLTAAVPSCPGWNIGQLLTRFAPPDPTGRWTRPRFRAERRRSTPAGSLPMHFDVHPWMRELLGSFG